MIRSFRLVACAAVALVALPGLVRAATGPHPPDSPACEASVQQPQHAEKEDWRDRFTDWLRRHATREPGERGSYYLRSPLLSAFGVRAHADCGEDDEEAIALANAAERCAAIIVSTRTDARMIMELPLPQLGALDGAALVVVVQESLARGEPVRVYDHEGNPLTLDPVITKGVQTQACG